MPPALDRLPAIYKLPYMNTDKIHLLRSFIESLETGDNVFKQSVLEALDAYAQTDANRAEEQAMQEAVMDDSGRRLDEFGLPEDGIGMQWVTMQNNLKNFVGDNKADDMLVILRNGADGIYKVFKKDGNVEFVTNTPQDSLSPFARKPIAPQ